MECTAQKKLFQTFWHRKWILFCRCVKAVRKILAYKLTLKNSSWAEFPD